MVSRETSHNLSDDFIAGIISVSGSFLHTKTARVEQFGFQIKTPKENFALLEMIRLRLGLKGSVKIYSADGSEYALLITRSKKELLNKIIPFVEHKLLGIKLNQYLNWKDKLQSIL